MSEHIHFIGIGGSGLSAIARLLNEQGNSVSGSDHTPSSVTSELAAAGIQIFIGHDPNNIVGANLIVRSSAIPDENAEVIAARIAGIPVLKRSDFINQLMHGQECIAVAGTHGKTTTTSMIAWILVSLGKDPSYIIGGISRNLKTNAQAGKGPYFVIEADEYDHMFMGLKPSWAVITNIEHDHPDCYPTAEGYFDAFTAFANQVKPEGTLLVNSDDPGTRGLIESNLTIRQLLTFSHLPNSNYWPESIRTNDAGGSDFSLWHKSSSNQPVELAALSIQIPGQHNIVNTIAAMGIAHQIGLPLNEASSALKRFIGAGRRFEIIGEVNGITVIDDYAHHPTEIRATLQAARSRYPSRRLWVVWQPHTFSRVQTLFDDFTNAFTAADFVIVTEVYAAREKNELFSASQIVEHIHHSNVRFAPTFKIAIDILSHEMVSGDVLIVLSAGDATQISVAVLSHLEKGGEEAENARI
jgi:UDP-N-acetylmuramate--alanine ligase